MVGDVLGRFQGELRSPALAFGRDVARERGRELAEDGG